MLFDEDMIFKASGKFLPCAYCGKREWLKLRRATRYDPVKRIEDCYYSVHCEACRLSYGEIDGEPIYDSESALIADWNRRAY